MSDLSKRPLVIYHGDCYDGFTAAWVFRKFMGDDVEYHAARYGEDPPDCKGRKVWILDFCYPRDVLIKKVIIPSTATTIYDHHKTAEAALKGIKSELWHRGVQRNADKIVFDMHRSGAGITYDELDHALGVKRGRHEPRYNGQRRDRLVDYIEDRDIWKFKWEKSQEVSAWISTVPMTFEDYDLLNTLLSVGETFRGVVAKGAAIMKYIDLFGDKAIKHAKIEKIGGYDVPTINVPYMNCSEHIGKLAEGHTAAFAAGYFRRDDGKWQFGLRSRGEFDVSEIAKQYGGGGHKNAAGFQVKVLPWEAIPAAEVKEAFMKLKPHNDSHKKMPGKMPIIDAQGIPADSQKGKVSTIAIGDNSAEVEDHPEDKEVDFDED